MFGYKWTTGFGEKADPTGAWLACLQGLSPRQIADGLSAVAKSGREWPPGAPEFRALCLPNANSLGLPDETAAYNAFCAVTNTGSTINWRGVHPAIYYTYLQLDQFAMKRVVGAQHRSMFIDAYRQTLTKALSGFEFPKVPQSLEYRDSSVSDEERTQRKQRAKYEMAKILDTFRT